MKLACLCPTYKRPDHLANVLQCFLQQDYPSANRWLYVLDDAGQYQEYDGLGMTIVSRDQRYPSLPDKWNALARLALADGADALVVWEDDDVYLPWYLSTVAGHLEAGASSVCWREVWSTYNCEPGEAKREASGRPGGRFHASWAFTADVYRRVGGWPMTTRLDYDQQLGARLRDVGGWAIADPPQGPGYVYRWGNGLYHGSQWGETDDWYRRVSTLDLPGDRRPLVPRCDDETRLLYRRLAGREMDG